MTLSEVCKRVGVAFEGDGSLEIRGVASLDMAGKGDLSFLANLKYAPDAKSSKASALIVPEEWEGTSSAALIRVKNPDEVFAKVSMLFYRPPPDPLPGVHATALVAEDVELGEGVCIGPYCVVEPGVRLGRGTVLRAHNYIGHACVIGEQSVLYPHVSVRENVQIGSRVIIHNGTVIGSDGFGYSVDRNGVRTKIPQIGTVVVGNDVEIGANVTIDRARFGKTVIGNGVKIDNLVQIAHNVVIGDHAVIVAQVGIAGSSSIGEKTILAGQAGISGHIRIGSGVIVGPQSGVTKDLPDGIHVLGQPAAPVQRMKRTHAAIMLLPRMKERLSELQERVRQLEQALRDRPRG